MHENSPLIKNKQHGNGLATLVHINNKHYSVNNNSVARNDNTRSGQNYMSRSIKLQQQSNMGVEPQYEHFQ